MGRWIAPVRLRHGRGPADTDLTRANRSVARATANCAVHYCQSCEQATAMEPHGGSARCPSCGRVDNAAAIEPLFVVTGASAAGKTTVFPHVAQLLGGKCVTFDVDWLLDPAVALGGRTSIAELDWDAFRDAWLAIAHGAAQSGFPTLLFGPLIPQHLSGLPNRKWVGEIHFVLLDCSDELRRERIEGRPPWRSRDVEAQTEFGRWLRANIADRVDTSQGTPEEVAHAVAARVLERLTVNRSGSRVPDPRR